MLMNNIRLLNASMPDIKKPNLHYQASTLQDLRDKCGRLTTSKVGNLLPIVPDSGMAFAFSLCNS